MTSARVLEELVLFNLRKNNKKSDRPTFADVCNCVNVASWKEKGNRSEGILST